VRNSAATLNGNNGDGAGIHCTTGGGTSNRIEGNNVTDNDRGIDVDSTGNLILRNSASDNTTNYEIAADNRYGPIEDITAGGTAAVSGSSAPGTASSSNPWTNFSY
jgi:parallel beta-helix repeat protein